MTYGNGDTMRYVYDEYDRVIQVNYNEASNSQYRSTYGADGSVARTDDTLNRLSNYYTNDSTGRLLRMVVKDTGSTNNGCDASYEYGYDLNNNIIKRKATIGSDSRTFQYNFMEDNLLGRADMPNGGYLTRSHDNFNRVTVKDINITSEITPRIRSAFTYYDVEGTNKTSFHIKTMQNSGVPGGSKYTYVYDKLGNITRITETKDGIDKTIDYTYDELSQLTREINEVTGQQVDYVYDLGGNIVSKTITDLATNESTVVPYTYDGAWKDKMVSFDGKAITYDAIGNPLTYDGDNYAWTQGRKLQSITGSGKNIRYSYTNDGMRLYKLVNGVRTNFYYDNGRLAGQQTGGVNTFFYYNGDDELVGLEHGGAVYYFTSNITAKFKPHKRRFVGLSCVLMLLNAGKNQTVIYT